MTQEIYFNNINDLDSGIKRVLGMEFLQEFFVEINQCYLL